MELDHVLLAVSDLALEARRLAREHCLESYEGGHHPGWGTANWIVPLGAAYLELIAVVDEAEASQSPFGSRVASAARRSGQPLGWAVRPDHLGGTAQRLGLTIGEGTRTTPSGDIVSWRSAGLDVALVRPHLPFFIEWRDPARFPGATAEPSATIERIELEGEADELTAWLGVHSLPLDVRAGTSGVTGVVLQGRRGPIRLGG